MKRRHFLALSSAALVSAQEKSASPLRAAVIGHTGRGDYGHGLDRIFSGRPGIELVALADADETGRKKMASSLGVTRHYADYREMLEKEKPALVSVAMRQADQHRDIILAALKAGAHVYAEKPVTRSPGEADELLAAAEAGKLKVAVAHTNRGSKHIRRLRDAIRDEKLIGDLVGMRAFGKQDPVRAGGEDLMVLGSHLMDLMRMLAGEPVWCSARVLTDGRDITKADARLVKDDVGLVAGNEVFAHYAFSGGANATFASSARLRESTGFWGIEITGSKGAARINCDLSPNAFLRKTDGVPKNPGESWVPFDPDSVKKPDAHPLDPVSDWLEAIRDNREPVCSLKNAARAVEMVCAVYASALSGSRATFPLKERRHPLE